MLGVIILVVLVSTLVKQSHAAPCLNVTNQCHLYNEACYKQQKTDKNCPGDQHYHCARHPTSTSNNFIEVCAVPKLCGIGTEPIIEYIHGAKGAQVSCVKCRDNSRYNYQDATWSYKISECPKKKSDCSPLEHKVLCGYENKDDVYTKNTRCRCDVRNGYIMDKSYDPTKNACTYEDGFGCMRAWCFPEKDVLLQGYICEEKCPRGENRSSEKTDECIPNSTPAPPTTPAIVATPVQENTTNDAPSVPQPATPPSKQSTPTTTPKPTTSTQKSTTTAGSSSKLVNNVIYGCVAGVVLIIVAGCIAAVIYRHTILGWWHNLRNGGCCVRITNIYNNHGTMINNTDNHMVTINVEKNHDEREGVIEPLLKDGSDRNSPQHSDSPHGSRDSCSLHSHASNDNVSGTGNTNDIDTHRESAKVSESVQRKYRSADNLCEGTSRSEENITKGHDMTTSRETNYDIEVTDFTILKHESIDDDKLKKEMMKHAIAKSFPFFVKNMKSPEELLDHFHAKGVLTEIGIGDIRENSKTTGKNREILDRINRSDWKTYLKFKESLMEINEKECVRTFEEMEQCFLKEGNGEAGQAGVVDGHEENEDLPGSIDNVQREEMDFMDEEKNIVTDTRSHGSGDTGLTAYLQTGDTEEYLDDAQEEKCELWNSEESSKPVLQIGPYTIFNSSIESIQRQLTDEVMDAYMYLLTKKTTRKVLHIPSVLCTAVFTGQHEVHEYLPTENLTDYDLCVGAVNEKKCHWTLVIIRPRQSTLVYINPLGELPVTEQQFVHYWYNFLQKRVDLGIDSIPHGTWSLQTPKHAKQSDGESCGIFVLHLAECFLNGADLNFNWSKQDVLSARERISECLLDKGEPIDQSEVANQPEIPSQDPESFMEVTEDDDVKNREHV